MVVVFPIWLLESHHNTSNNHTYILLSAILSDIMLSSSKIVIISFQQLYYRFLIIISFGWWRSRHRALEHTSGFEAKVWTFNNCSRSTYHQELVWCWIRNQVKDQKTHLLTPRLHSWAILPPHLGTLYFLMFHGRS